MPSSTSNHTLVIILLLAIGAGMSACAGRQVRPPPDCFLPDAPILTGDADLDARVARAREIAELQPAEYQALRKSVAAVGSAENVETMVLHVLGNGDAEEALAILWAWTEATNFSEAAMATYLDLAIGTDRAEECIVASDKFLAVHDDHPFLLLLRGLCLRDYGRPEAGAASLHAGMGGIEALGGFSGVLERELGIARSETEIPALGLLQDRLGLMDYMTRFSVLGHVVVRHATGMSVEQAAADPRLMDLGGVTSDEVDRIFATRRDSFRHCQLLAKKRRKVPGGRLVIRLTIRRDGSPGEIERVRNTFESEEIPACIEEQIGYMWYLPPRYGKAVVTERDFRMLGD